MIPSPFSFNSTKVVVFFETEPLSDKFEQIMFTHENYVKLLDLIESFLPHPESGGFVVTTNDEEAYEFPNIRNSYPPEEIVNEV